MRGEGEREGEGRGRGRDPTSMQDNKQVASRFWHDAHLHTVKRHGMVVFGTLVCCATLCRSAWAIDCGLSSRTQSTWCRWSLRGSSQQ